MAAGSSNHAFAHRRAAGPHDALARKRVVDRSAVDQDELDSLVSMIPALRKHAQLLERSQHENRGPLRRHDRARLLRGLQCR